MSRMRSEYPERVYSPGEEERRRGDLMERGRVRGLSAGLLLGGLVAMGVGAWMLWHFGPDLVRYLKMERM